MQSLTVVQKIQCDEGRIILEEPVLMNSWEAAPVMSTGHVLKRERKYSEIVFDGDGQKFKDKRELKLERNRLSSLKYRKRKKKCQFELEEEILTSLAENEALKSLAEMIHKEREQLLKTIDELRALHGDCSS